MFIVKFYTIQLVVFSGFLNYTYAMVDRSEKHHHQQSFRSDRQFRPVVNSIIFLIAANLVAKGALGLGTYQAPQIPNNVQGSLFLTLNAPTNPQQIAHQYLPLWFPTPGHLAPSSTQAPVPIAQTQIVHIGEPVYEELEELESSKQGPYMQKLFINRYNSIEDQLEPAFSNEVEVKTKPEVVTTEVNTEETTTIDNDVEILPQNFTNTGEVLLEVARQLSQPNLTTTTTTMRPTTTTLNPITEGTTPMTTQGAGTNNTNATSSGQNGYGYGPSNGYDNISFTYGAPPAGNGTGSNTTILGNSTLPHGNLSNAYGLPSLYGPYIHNATISNRTEPGYHYFPAGNYGPYTGKENVSFTYGPPVYQRPVYQKPFFSSPEDPYLNNYNQYYNNFYDNSPPYYSDMYKYSDVFKNFYNNYPSFFNNYLGK